MNDFLIVAIPIILLLSLGAILFFLIKQRKKNDAEEKKIMDKLKEQIKNENNQTESNLNSLSSQIILLLTEIKNSNIHIEKHMNFFKTLAIISIIIGIIIGFITIVTAK